MNTKHIQLLILAIAMTATGWSHSQVPHHTRAARGEAFVPHPGAARAASFGFKAALADYHWLQAVQVAGHHDIIGPDTAAHLGRLIDVVTTLNPHVGHPYRFAAVWLTHSPQQVREGIRLLERAIEHQPDEWRNFFYLGFNHFYYLGEFEQAAQVLERAIHLEGRPVYLPRLVARLKSEHADVDVAEVFIRELYASSQDEEVKAKLQAALDEIEIEYKARHLDRARAAYKEIAGRDIERVEDLVTGPHAVLERLPNPEPDSMPASLSRGSVWELNEKEDRIESSYLGGRYEVHFQPRDRKRLEAWSKAGSETESETSGVAREDG